MYQLKYLFGVTIGNNVVIGAGPIVNKNIMDNIIIAGVPAKIIKTTDGYKKSIIKKGCIISDQANKKKTILNYLENL